MTFEECLNQSSKKRHEFWSQYGKCHSHVLTPAINPALGGQPPWPATRQAYLPVDVAGHLLLCTEGLSDPFDDGGALDKNGFEIEFFIEAPEVKYSEELADIAKSWAASALVQMAGHSAAGGGSERELLDEWKFLSIEFLIPGIPEKCRNKRGNASFMLGVPAPGLSKQIELALTPARLVAVTYITPKEAEYAIAHDDGRVQLAKILADNKIHHKSLLNRADLV